MPESPQRGKAIGNASSYDLIANRETRTVEPETSADREVRLSFFVLVVLLCFSALSPFNYSSVTYSFVFLVVCV